MTKDKDGNIALATRILEAEMAVVQAEDHLKERERAAACVSARAREALKVANAPGCTSAAYAAALHADAADRVWTSEAERARRAVEDARQAADAIRQQYSPDEFEAVLTKFIQIVIQRTP